MATKAASGGIQDTGTGVGWGPLAVLATGQFVMVLDSAVMNVSISNIVADLNTTVAGVQLAITAYTLVMASFMLAGAKLSSRWGASRTFRIGLGVYGTGSLITAISPNLGTLLFGWSLVEGLGAVLVIPAIASLCVTTYEGQQRAFAYGMIGGISGAAIAAGPLIGGWVTTNYTWRYVFLGEVVLVIGMLIAGRTMMRTPRPAGPAEKFDVPGTVLSAVGFGIGVLSILRSSVWGWIRPLNPPVLLGHEITPLGLSPVPFLVLLSALILTRFVHVERTRSAAGKPTLLSPGIVQSAVTRAGLSTLALQQLTLLGMFFLLPVYLQMVLGLDAFESGVRIFPLSVALLGMSLLGPKMAARRSPRTVVRIGLAALVFGSMATAGTVNVDATDPAFGIALALFGAGAGLLLSQLGNVIMSSAPTGRSTEAGGLQGTAQNLGASLGTALIGSVLLTGLTSGVVDQVTSNPSIPANVSSAVLDQAAQGLDVVPVDSVEQAAVDAGLSQADAKQLADGYADEELYALKRALFAVALLTTLGWWTSRHLPKRSARPDR